MPTGSSDRSIIVDANVAVAWVIDRPYSADAMKFIDGGWNILAPDILLSEAGSALSYYVRTEAISGAQARQALELIVSAVELVPVPALVFDAMELSIQARHPIYDCLYLSLARSTSRAIVSADRKLNLVAARFDIASQSLT